jgi:AcrR family transcriptional regulator
LHSGLLEGYALYRLDGIVGLVKDARSRITQAAMELAARDGSVALTLETVASAANVSKGGLLYHFATKEALLAGLVRECLDRWSALVSEKSARDPEPIGAEARAYVDVAASIGQDPTRELALLAATALDPATAGLWREAAGKWIAADTVEDDDFAIDLLVARLAADGLWLARALDLYQLSDELIVDVATRLRRFASPTSEEKV